MESVRKQALKRQMVCGLFIVIIPATFVNGGNEAQPDCGPCFGLLCSIGQNETQGHSVDPLASNMHVYIENPGPYDDTMMCVKCWSGNHDKDKCNCAKKGQTIDLSWSFTAGATTKFWCEAAWGKGRWDRTAKLSQFAVFGDGVPKKSSDWKVNAGGRVRYQEDGKPTNGDYSSPWTGIMP